MSPLPTTDHARIYVSPQGIAVAVCTGWAPRIARTAWQACASPQWPDILDALRQVLVQPDLPRRIELRLASPLLRLALLPFDAAITDPAIEQAVASTIITRTFGTDPATQPQRIALAPAAFGRARLIAALDESHAADLEALVHRHGHALTALTPVAARVLGAAGPAIAGNPGTVALLETDRLLLIDHDGNAPVAVRVRPWHNGDTLPPSGAHSLLVAPGPVAITGRTGWRDAVLRQPAGATRHADARVLLAACTG